MRSAIAALSRCIACCVDGDDRGSSLAERDRIVDCGQRSFSIAIFGMSCGDACAASSPVFE
jgi:hypothetical protein